MANCVACGRPMKKQGGQCTCTNEKCRKYLEAQSCGGGSKKSVLASELRKGGE